MTSGISQAGVYLSWLTAAMLLSAGVALPIAHAQLLDRASSAVRGDDSSGSSRRESSRSSDDDRRSSRDLRDDGGGVLDSSSRAVRSGGGSGYRSSRRADPYYGGGGGPSSRVYVGYGTVLVLGSAPYVDGASGYARPPMQDEGARAAVRAELEGGYALAGAGRAGAGVRVHLPAPVDLSARYSLFIEPRPAGTDFAALGRVGIDWRFLDIPEMQGRVGAAFRHFQDSAGGMFGADAALGFDIFAGSPWVISLDASAGIVGAAMVVQLRASIGVLIEMCEIYAGYDYEALFIESANVDLGGPMLGLRLWGG